MLEVATVAFLINPVTGGTNSCFINQLSTLEIQTVTF